MRVKSDNFYRRHEIDQACYARLDILRHAIKRQDDIILDMSITDRAVLDAAYAERQTLYAQRKKFLGWISKPSTADLKELGLE